jgi:hypothetical protein
MSNGKQILSCLVFFPIMKEREMQSYIMECEREVAEREAAWKAELSRHEVITAVFFPSAVLTLKPQTISARCSCLRAVHVVDELADVAQCQHIFISSIIACNPILAHRH